MAEPIKTSLRMWTWVCGMKHILDRDQIRTSEGIILSGKMAAHCKVQGLCAVSCAKMAVQITMQLGILSLVGQGNHELAGVHTGTT